MKTVRAYTMCLLSMCIYVEDIVAQEITDEDRRIWENYAREKYGDLNREHSGELDGLFEFLGLITYLQPFYVIDEDTATTRAYKEFLLQTILEAAKGDITEAVFVNTSFSFAPPEAFMRSIVSEIGEGGKLEVLFMGVGNDLTEHLQKQNQQGYPGSPNFETYGEFLREDVPNKDIIIRHMMRYDSHVGFHEMLLVEFDYSPDPIRRPLLVGGGGPVPEVWESNPFRRSDARAKDGAALLIMEHQVYEVVLHARLGTPIPQVALRKAQDNLRALATRPEWWIRLYTLCVMTQAESLRDPFILSILGNDSDNHVRQAVSDLRVYIEQGN